MKNVLDLYRICIFGQYIGREFSSNRDTYTLDQMSSLGLAVEIWLFWNSLHIWLFLQKEKSRWYTDSDMFYKISQNMSMSYSLVHSAHQIILPHDTGEVSATKAYDYAIVLIIDTCYDLTCWLHLIMHTVFRLTLSYRIEWALFKFWLSYCTAISQNEPIL